MQTDNITTKDFFSELNSQTKTDKNRAEKIGDFKSLLKVSTAEMASFSKANNSEKLPFNSTSNMVELVNSYQNDGVKKDTNYHETDNKVKEQPKKDEKTNQDNDSSVKNTSENKTQKDSETTEKSPSNNKKVDKKTDKKDKDDDFLATDTQILPAEMITGNEIDNNQDILDVTMMGENPFVTGENPVETNEDLSFNDLDSDILPISENTKNNKTNGDLVTNNLDLTSNSNDNFVIGDDDQTNMANFADLLTGDIKNSKTVDSNQNIFKVANDNGVNDNDMGVAVDLDFIADTISDKSEKGKQGKIDDIEQAQAQEISKIIGANESAVITVGKELNKENKNTVFGINNSASMVMNNADGETEVLVNQIQTVSDAKNADNNLENKTEGTTVSSSNSMNNMMVGNEMGSSGQSILNTETNKGSVSNTVNTDFSLLVNGKGVDTSSTKTGVIETAKGLEIKAENITDQLKIKMSNLKEGENTISIKLKPHELGEIEVKLNITKDGKVSAVINSNKEETNNILQKNVQVLEKMFTDTGYKADVSSFNFSFRGSNSNGENANNGNNSENSKNNNGDGSNSKGEFQNADLTDNDYQRRGILA